MLSCCVEVDGSPSWLGPKPQAKSLPFLKKQHEANRSNPRDSSGGAMTLFRRQARSAWVDAVNALS